MIPGGLLRRIRVVGVALVATLLALGWVVIAGAGLPGAAPAPRAPRTIPFSDVHPYGANFFLEREPEAWKRDQAVQRAQEAAIRWARQQFPWADVQPEVGGPYLWEKYDDLVDLYTSHGIDVIARLDWSPRWARADWVPDTNNPPDAAHLADYARFAGAAAAHFKDRVRFYQIWNEPNLRTEWGLQPADPDAYVALLAAAAKAIRAADPNAVVLAAPLAITTEDVALAGNMNDVSYLEAMYAAGAAPFFDIMSANAFGMDRPPADPPAPDTLNMRRIELERRVMVDHGDEVKAMWLSEYGWNAAPASMPDQRLLWRRVDEKHQAEWTVEGVEWGTEHWDWVGVFGIWYFQYYRSAEDKPEFYFRMVDLDFTPRRLYAAVSDASRALLVAGPGEWGEHSSPVTADAGWRWQWADGATGANARVTEAPGAVLSLRFQGNSVAARIKGAADAMRWSVDGNEVPADSPDPTTWQWVTLADGLGGGEHEARVEATGTGEIALDAFQVAGHAGLAPMGWRFLALFGLAVVLFAVLLRDLRRAAARVPEE